MILTSDYTKFGKITYINCHLNNLCISLGFTLIYIPILYRLVIGFPDRNKYSQWIENHKYLFILIFISFNILLCGIAIINPYGTQDIINNKGENFQICYINNTLNRLILIFSIVYKSCILFILSLLIFIERNINEFFYDVRFIMVSIYINIIAFIITIIINYFTIKNYISYFILKVSLIIVVSISSYIILYFVKIILPILTKKDEMTKILEKIKVNDSYLKKNTDTLNIKSNVSNTNSIKTKNTNFSNNSNSIYSKIFEYHYRSNDSVNSN